MPNSADAVLVITGSMGSGKTTVMGEASDLLQLQGIHHASIDLDTLRMAHLPAEQDARDLDRRNLQCVWQNFAALGLRRLLLATAIETRTDLESLQEVVPARVWVICRLRAALETMEKRVRSREPGIMQEQLVGRVSVLEEILDRSTLEDFSVTNDGRPVTDVAREVLTRAGWLQTAST